MDILLEDSTHDVVFVNGSSPMTGTTPIGLKQRLKIKLLTFKGEWFLNTNYGTPYFQEIFGKGRVKSTIDLLFRTLIKEDNDVVEILRFDSTLTAQRVYSLSFTVTSVEGQTLEINELEVGV
jgi:hypothetical protein